MTKTAKSTTNLHTSWPCANDDARTKKKEDKKSVREREREREKGKIKIINDILLSFVTCLAIVLLPSKTVSLIFFFHRYFLFVTIFFVFNVRFFIVLRLTAEL